LKKGVQIELTGLKKSQTSKWVLPAEAFSMRGRNWRENSKRGRYWREISKRGHNEQKRGVTGALFVKLPLLVPRYGKNTYFNFKTWNFITGGGRYKTSGFPAVKTGTFCSRTLAKLTFYLQMEFIYIIHMAFSDS
jgi:hypothetical protein